MQRVVSFYEKLPRGPAPAPQPKGLLERYQARYFGKNPSGMRKTPNGNLSSCRTRSLTRGSPHPPHRRSDRHWLRSELLLPSA